MDVAALTARVAENTTVIDSALTLIRGFQASQQALAAQLAAAIAAEDPAAIAAVQKAIDDSASQLAADDAGLAAAVAANTPAAPLPAAA